MSKVTIVLTSGTTWTVPLDCTSATVEVVGGCDFSGSGNGGGYSKTNNVSLTPLQKVYIQIGLQTTLTWFNKDTNSAPTYTANGASASQSSSSGIGDIKYSGGLSPTPTTFANAPGCCLYYYIYGGAGGQAGPNGNGANGGSATAVGDNTFGGGGGGGGANGGTVGSDAGNSPYRGGAGGNSFFGSGGIGQTASISATSGTNGSGGGGSYATSTSSPGTAGNGSLSYFWTDSYSKISYGVSGGPGGSVNSTTSSTNNFVGGSYEVNTGMTAGFGFIVITYTPTSPQTGTYVEAITNNSPAGWKVPAGVTSLKIECVGAGGTGNSFSTVSPANTAGAGGSYASNTVAVTPNDILNIQVGVSQSYSAGGQNSSTPGSTVVKTNSGVVLVCATGAAGGILSLGANNIGSTTFLGGAAGNNAFASTPGVNAGGGGGGAAGPGGAGKAGGNASATATSGRAGGGGGAGGTSSTVGGNASATVAGAGGAGPAGSGGGSAGTSGANPGNGTNGGGGGGGFSSATPSRWLGGTGGSNTVSSWTTSVQNATYGPGGGGGGAGAPTGGGNGGPGGGYGGGGGGGGISESVQRGAGGLIILTYTVTAANNISSPEMTPMFFR
jgi:hypothetical protein